MEKHSEREKSSRRTREERDRDRDSAKAHKDRDRDRHHKHRTREEVPSREIDEDHRHHRSSRDDKHRDRSDRDSKRERSHERSEREGSRGRAYDRDSKRERSHELRDEREGSRDRVYDVDGKRERSHEPPKSAREGSKDRVLREEESGERRHSSRSHNKRKEREESEGRVDGGEKRVRVSDERKERRRFEDTAEEEKQSNGREKEHRRGRRGFGDEVKDGDDANISSKEEKRERRKFGDRVKEENESNHVVLEAKKEIASLNGSGFIENGAALEPLNYPSRDVSETLSPSHPLPTKVSSIYTTNENKGVSITRSHEVPGKSSTDGSSAAAGKSGSLSLDALAKAKKALQMQKELSEKLKKIPLLNKGPVSSSNLDGSQQVGAKMASSNAGILPVPVPSLTATASIPVGATPNASIPAASVGAPGSGMASLPALTNMHNFEAVKRAQELAAKMGFHQDPEFAPLINMFPGQAAASTAAVQQKPAKAPVLRLDALGREVDEHGNVVNMPKLNNLSTLKVNINKQKKDAFQILKPELDVDPESNPHYDTRMGINKNKLLRPKKVNFQFVEEGKWSKDAEIIKLKSQFGEAQAKELKAKQAQLAKAKAEPDINPNLIEVSERVITKEKAKDPIPDIEWWDVPFLYSGTYDDVTDGNITDDKLKMDKITVYVEHPQPIEPPAEPAPPPPQPLKVTKKEQKKLRTQSRLRKEKERQEMIRQGLLEPPKPKVKMSNLMKVLGSEATQDPTRLEMEIRSAAAEREQAHVDRNIARKLTPAERREKKERKLFDDPNAVETIVSVYKINNLSHPKTRFKVDVNAQENRLTGCAVISDGMSVVVVEGGSKSIKRYGKLMLRRINWADAVGNDDEEGDENEEKPVNKCVLVWQGSVAKPGFNRFFVHECRTEAAARKVFADAGVVHYWDLAVNFSDDQL